MALAVCLLLDPAADDAVRRLWARMEEAGAASLQSHTDGHHLPHFSYAALRSWDLAAVTTSLTALPEQPPLRIDLDALGMSRRSRCWLAPALTPDLGPRRLAVVDAARATGTDLPMAAGLVNDVLPITGIASTGALIDTATGERHPLPHLV
jgi:hypothetical protein